MRGFWKNWMTVWCWGTLVFGVVLALAAAPATDGAARFVFALIGGDRAGEMSLDLPVMRFAFGLQGALTIGWAITMFGMVRAAEAGGAPVWRSLTLGLLAWYVIDSSISVMTGFPLNAVSNSALVVTFLAPVLASGALRAVSMVEAAGQARLDSGD